ncbi:MAG: D-2-hydroxyacid dehydrogenase [Chloroflexaceae bacterium]|jgi:phosphoglycerate dehydrogenase-like enzyme|nr:D-2-hydroxyacid dehydrogenase [Chloroflexaceae bacterium]
MQIILPVQIASSIEPLLPPDMTVVHVDADGKLDGDASEAEIYFRWWTPNAVLNQVLLAAPRVRWLHTPSAGVDHVLTPLVLERDLTVTNNAGVHAIPMAEFVLGYLLSHAKSLPALHIAQAENRWANHKANELYEKTLLIIGLGGIGEAVATRAAAFGMRVWGSRRTPRPTAGVERVVGANAWRELLPDADYVVLIAPLTEETRGMVDEAAFRSMKRSAYFVNVARGAIVDEAALLRALHEGWIAGAAIDTFEEEPLPPDSPFWQAPNLFITPHTTSSSPRMRERTIALFLENLRRYRNHEPLLNVVDKEAGY